MMNRDFGKEGPQDSHSERGTIAERQGPSENANPEANPTRPKTDSSGCFGMRKKHSIYGEIMLHPVITPVFSLVAGILILLFPAVLNYVVAIYLIIIGIFGIMASA